jgi:hypothetical protein
MAIIDLFECQVLVNGKVLQEYKHNEEDDDDNDYPEGTKVAMRYIEAVPGAKFALKIHVMRGYTFNDAEYLNTDFILDGQLQDNALIEKSSHSRSKGSSYTHFGAYSMTGTEQTIRKFQFGDIVTRKKISGRLDLRLTLVLLKENSPLPTPMRISKADTVNSVA